MKIGVVYFSHNITEESRKHHSVSDNLLSLWLRFYKHSQTTIQPVLITDQNTIIPKIWDYEYVRVSDCDPKKSKDVLNKVGWLKHQAFDYIGKCLLLDVDAFIVSNLDDLNNYDCPFAMAMDFNSYEKEWWFYQEWPECKYKHNAGVMILNTPEVGTMFKIIWEEKFDQFQTITFLDEVIFSEIKNKLNGASLDLRYNHVWDYSLPEDCKIVHFSGENKYKIKDFVRSYFLI